MQDQMTSSAASVRVVHHVPGRLRLRLERGVNVPETCALLQETLRSYPGVQSVTVHPRARSVVVTYSAAELEVQRLIDEGLPAAAVDVLDAGLEAVATIASGTAVGRGVVKAVGSVNNRLERATGGVLDLRDAFPLTLFALGIRRVLQGNLQPVPWYNLLYYGYSTFVALHGRRGGQAPAPEPDAIELLRRRYARGQITTDQYREMLVELGAADIADVKGTLRAPDADAQESALVDSSAALGDVEAVPSEAESDQGQPRRRGARRRPR